MTFLSYSSMSTYEECPKKYYFQRVLRLKRDDDTRRFLHGGLVGKVIELWYQGQHYKDGQNARQWLHDNLEPIYKSDPDLQKDRRKALWENFGEEQAMIDSCHPMLDTFLDLAKEHRLIAPVVKPEMEMTHKYGGDRVINGRLDIWVPKESKPGIVDFKATARKQATPDQLLFYVLLSKHTRKASPAIAFMYLKLGQMDWIDYADADVDALEQRIHGVFDKIDRQEFPAKPGNACYFCKYKADCPDYRKSQQKILPEHARRSEGDFGIKEVF
jgi:CRISPR/Cas system-associated exonuclease Cas4 (RecB family)